MIVTVAQVVLRVMTDVTPRFALLSLTLSSSACLALLLSKRTHAFERLRQPKPHD